jgi:endonuclease/exonuclease/phosphatase family metal-dependent hydrolase
VTLQLLSYNIRRGGAGREQPLAAVIRAVAPDIVVLEEATRPEVAECLARETGMQQWSARAGKSLGFMSRQPVTFDVRMLPRRLRALVWLSGGHIRWRTIATVLSAGYVDSFRRLPGRSWIYAADS